MRHPATVRSAVSTTCPTCGELFAVRLETSTAGMNGECALCGESVTVTQGPSRHRSNEYSWELQQLVTMLVLDESRRLADVATDKHLPDELVRS
jgi:predicted RNA-binding Zn-ribbon protein involved in translation (DUF1610 family)